MIRIYSKGLLDRYIMYKKNGISVEMYYFSKQLARLAIDHNTGMEFTRHAIYSLVCVTTSRTAGNTSQWLCHSGA
jgi:hypothetical protein